MAEQLQPPTDTRQSRNASHESIQSSLEEVWYLKEISFKADKDAPFRRYKIITQNFNGLVKFDLTCVLVYLGILTRFQAVLIYSNMYENTATHAGTMAHF